jgi:hypothetical protein
MPNDTLHMTVDFVTLNIKTFSIMILSIEGLFVTLNNIQPNDIPYIRLICDTKNNFTKYNNTIIGSCLSDTQYIDPLYYQKNIMSVVMLTAAYAESLHVDFCTAVFVMFIKPWSI